MRIYNLDYWLFADVFSDDLPKDPADIPPFNFIVHNTKWKVGKNISPDIFICDNTSIVEGEGSHG